jgi:predicted metal-binding membrane protein
MPADNLSPTEYLLKRDRAIVLSGMVALTLLAWAYLLSGAGVGMSLRETTMLSLFPHRMADMPMPGMGMRTAGWTVGHFIIVMLMWWVMMIAMMTPSAAPMILLYARATRHAQGSGQLEQGVVPTAAFAGRYLAVWLPFSLLAAGLQWGLEQSGLVCAMMMASTSGSASPGYLPPQASISFPPSSTYACAIVARQQNFFPTTGGRVIGSTAHGA